MSENGGSGVGKDGNDVRVTWFGLGGSRARLWCIFDI